MTGETQNILYYLNEADEIVTVNSAWNRFARENGAPGALSYNVQWRPLWEFINDGTTSLICRRLIRRAREGSNVDFCFRCDAPETIRLARMRMRRQRGGLVEVCVRTIGTITRRPLPITQAPRSVSGHAQWCSWCQRIEVAPGEWFVAEDAMGEMASASWRYPIRVRAGSCPDCVARMIGIADAGRAQAPIVPHLLWPPQPALTARRPSWSMLPARMRVADEA
ncbi:MAG TPA: hypothetical protein VMM36_06055 [Opitutaceae bacterium]|nr:hypothetical protein [Opitutaceae bacterium]